MRIAKTPPPSARVVERDAAAPLLQIRNKKGGWFGLTRAALGQCEAIADSLEDLAAWARADERRRMAAERRRKG